MGAGIENMSEKKNFQNFKTLLLIDGKDGMVAQAG